MTELKLKGYDGLCNENGLCACAGDAPCGDGPYVDCVAAMAGEGGEDAEGQFCDVLYYPVKASRT